MKNIKLIIASLLLIAYFYCFFLCLWGKPLYGQTGNIQYIIAFHLLAIVNYFTVSVIADRFRAKLLQNKNELFFLLHGGLISAFPYSNYLVAGAILMAAALVASSIKSRT